MPPGALLVASIMRQGRGFWVEGEAEVTQVGWHWFGASQSWLGCRCGWLPCSESTSCGSLVDALSCRKGLRSDGGVGDRGDNYRFYGDIGGPNGGRL